MNILAPPWFARVTTNFTVNASTTLANITELVMPRDDDNGPVIQNGGIYEYEVMLMTTSAVDAGVKAALAAGGTPALTITALRGQIEIIDGAAAVPVTNGRQTALGTGAGVTAVTVAAVFMWGCFVVNIAGPLAVQFAQNASQASDAIVLPQSYFKLSRVDSFYQPVWQKPA